MSRAYAIVGLLFLVSTVAAYGKVTVLVMTLGNPSDPALSRIISSAAVLQLAQDNLNASTESAAASSKPPESQSAPGFVLAISYSSRKGMVAMDLSFRSARGGTPIADIAKSVPFDLNLDMSVSDLVKSVIERPAVAQALKKASEVAKPTESVQAVPRKAAEPTKSAGPSPLPAPARHPKTVTAELKQRPATRGQWGFVAELRGAPMILVGTGSDYFRYGADVSLFSAVRYPLSTLTLETGLLAGASELFSVFGTGAGQVYALSVGPEVRIGNAPDSPAQIGLVASGGATVLLVHPAGGGPEAKTDLFAGGGVTASIELARIISIGVKIGARVIFEERYPIFAVLPALTVGLSP